MDSFDCDMLHSSANEKSPAFIQLQQSATRREAVFSVDISYTFDKRLVEIGQIIRPFEILNLPKTTTNLKAAFRQKIVSTDRKQRALLSLSYTMGTAYIHKQIPPYFREVDASVPSYRYDAASPLVWSMTGFCPAVRALGAANYPLKEVETLDGKSLLYMAIQSNMADVVEVLLDSGCLINDWSRCDSTPLNVAAFFNHSFLVRYLIYHGADPQAKKSSAAAPMKELMLAPAAQPLPTFLRTVLGVCNLGMGEIQHIRHGGRLVAFRMAKALDEKLRAQVMHNWYLAWHGTRVQHVLSILQYGLCKPGDKVGTGEVRIRPGHIRRGVSLHGVADWGNAIFLTKSAKYACNSVYSDRLMCKRADGTRDQFCVLIETAARPGSFGEYPSTTPSYIPGRGDPKDQEEMRVGGSSSSSRLSTPLDTETLKAIAGEGSIGSPTVRLARVGKAVDVVVTGVVLVQEEFIERTELLQDQLHALLRGFWKEK